MSDTICLINSNRMVPGIGPLGLEYVGGAVRRAGIGVDLVDLCLAEDADLRLEQYFAGHEPALVGVTFRNVDDCFWPSCRSFVDDMTVLIRRIKDLSGAPVVIGGVGYSIFGRRLVEYAGADFGIVGDGERPIVELFEQLRDGRRFGQIAGLVWRSDGDIVSNEPAWDEDLALATTRDVIDNAEYFRRGGQAGFETKRGCLKYGCMGCGAIVGIPMIVIVVLLVLGLLTGRGEERIEPLDRSQPIPASATIARTVRGRRLCRLGREPLRSSAKTASTPMATARWTATAI